MEREIVLVEKKRWIVKLCWSLITFQSVLFIAVFVGPCIHVCFNSFKKIVAQLVLCPQQDYAHCTTLWFHTYGTTIPDCSRTPGLDQENRNIWWQSASVCSTDVSTSSCPTARPQASTGCIPSPAEEPREGNTDQVSLGIVSCSLVLCLRISKDNEKATQREEENGKGRE